eukprot:3103414-Heterocapsa_arctica.AAC.2
MLLLQLLLDEALPELLCHRPEHVARAVGHASAPLSCLGPGAGLPPGELCHAPQGIPRSAGAVPPGDPRELAARRATRRRSPSALPRSAPPSPKRRHTA